MPVIMASSSTVSSERCFHRCQPHQQMFPAADWNVSQNNIILRLRSWEVSLSSFLLVYFLYASPLLAAIRPILPRIVEILVHTWLNTLPSNCRRTVVAVPIAWHMWFSHSSSIWESFPSLFYNSLLYQTKLIYSSPWKNQNFNGCPQDPTVL